MSSWGLSAPGPNKSKTESKKSPNRLFFNYFDSFSTLCFSFGTDLTTPPLHPPCRGAKLGLFGFLTFFPQFCSVFGGEK